MKSVSIHSVFITTEHDCSYIESSATYSVSDKGRITVFAPESDELYYDADFDAIKGRGNSTWGGSAKKPYQIKLKKLNFFRTERNQRRGFCWRMSQIPRFCGTQSRSSSLPISALTAPRAASLAIFITTASIVETTW